MRRLTISIIAAIAWAASGPVPARAETIDVYDDHGGPVAEYDARWAELAVTLKDCRALLVNAAGPTPMRVLTQHGLKVVEMEGLIDEGLRAVFDDKPIPAGLKRRFTSCGAGVTCKGTGNGCG